MRGRKYPWGVAEVDNPEHCEFSKLRDMLIRTHLQDLKDVTAESLYEEFRKEAVSRRGGGERERCPVLNLQRSP